uniref:Uncharacterized protein n=1 Tax=Chromera velia CCMP2878 TaxID=1169474 RepID=A0A0G4HV40_9ALVE|eukprot:Cvel_32103.t1-p1 / transcript=Cvel_32103.t1 / gene=Cvel_32103 / organism=Chromera_velia_CCMP2878 / gene_product=Ankyrin repeat domain-containing protein 50, putative / transcript_product=Ankyrin repeat domain-containing protein 50, putative / location=Cvel_scaffold4915:2616-6701(-) / protein_length=964 / sequence_SO=supercontig / SO=protein_coding / is_pseudo=false
MSWPWKFEPIDERDHFLAPRGVRGRNSGSPFEQLLSAVKKGDEEAVVSLVESHRPRWGAAQHVSPVSLATGNGDSAGVAARRGRGGPVSLVEERDDEGRTALAIAAGGRYSGIVRLLIALGSDVESRDVFGTSPLMHAVMERRVENAEVLIESGGADVGAVDEDGRSALSWAAGVSVDERLVNVLISRKADVRRADNEGRDPLMHAAETGQARVGAALIWPCWNLPDGTTGGMGADVNLVAKKGLTALLLAAERGHEDFVALLLEGGCREGEHREEKLGRSALMLAAEGGHCGVVDRLLRAFRLVSEEVVEMRVMEESKEEGRTALCYAAENGHREVCILILKACPRLYGVGRENDRGRAAQYARENCYHGLSSLLDRYPSMPCEDLRGWEEAQEETWEPIAEYIREGALRLWPLEVLRFFLDKNVPVPPREEVQSSLLSLGMPSEQVQVFMRAAEALGQRGGSFPSRSGVSVVCLSYAWQSREHPDPCGVRLREVVETLEGQWWARGKQGHVFVFWDYLSLLLKRHNKKSDGHTTETTEEEETVSSASTDGSGKKLLARLDLLYSSSHTRVLRCTDVPSWAPNPRSFHERGWPLFEMCASGFKPSSLILIVSGETEGEEEENVGGLVPRKSSPVLFCCPDLFGPLLDHRDFSNRSDKEKVKKMYRKFVESTVTALTTISFGDLPTFDNTAAASLDTLLSYLIAYQLNPKVEVINLSRTSISDECLATLAETAGKLPKLRILVLSETAAGRLFVRSLRRSLENGKFAELRAVDLTCCENVDDSCSPDLCRSVEIARQRRGRTQNGHPAAVLRLLFEGANINSKEHDGSTALVSATMNGHLEAVRVLLQPEWHVEVDARRSDGSTALFGPVQKGDAAVAALLIRAGAGVNVRDYRGRTALIAAAENGHSELVAMLLAEGSKVNTQDSEGVSAFITAAQNGNGEAVALLLRARADLNLKERRSGWA